MQLREFYRDVNRAVKAETKPAWFKNCGLCDNLYNWYQNKAGINYRYKEWNRLKFRMLNQFENAGLSRLLPFNQSKMHSYIKECYNDTVYQNPMRLEWIKNHV